MFMNEYRKNHRSKLLNIENKREAALVHTASRQFCTANYEEYNPKKSKKRNFMLLYASLTLTSMFYEPSKAMENLKENTNVLIRSESKESFVEPDDTLEIKSYEIPSSTAKENFEKFVSDCKDDPYKNFKENMNLMGAKLAEVIPENIIQALKDAGKYGKPGIILLKGLPIDSIIPEHEDIKERVKLKGKVSENVILGISHIMECEARPNPNEQEGRIIHNVAPVKGLEKTQSSRGKEPLYLHTEEAFEENPPDFLILYGLVADPKAQTTYHFIDNFLGSFSSDVIEAMKKPQFQIKGNDGALDHPSVVTVSLITEEKEEKFGKKLRLRLYGYMEDVTPLTDEAKNVIQYVNNFFKEINPQKISLKPGEALIFNNGWGINNVGGIMHGRAGYIENPNRWLQRAFLFRK